VLRFCNPAARVESASRSDAPCGAACAVLCGPLPESRPRNRPPPSSSSAAVPSSSAASAAHCRLPLAPFADARPVSWPRPLSSPRRTRTLGGSVRTAPLWLSSPTSPLRFGLSPNQSTRSVMGGPKHTAELDQIRIPKSNRLILLSVVLRRYVSLAGSPAEA